ncbi:hypothetical protein ABZ249_20705 [Nocardiopsis sp. NPDC006139]|uniref:hypothetical protein n=1 Tax=Nocardiopsis sp. NPDC006139 TaxID=3154578 RepID=UPI0033BD91BA
MKASQLLRQIAMAAALVSVMLAASFRAFYPGYPGTVPWPATVPPALLLALALALVADADPDPTPGERRRLHTGAVPWPLTDRPRTDFAVIGLNLLMAVVFMLPGASLSLSPLVLVALTGCALAVVRARRERREFGESLAEPLLTGPKLVGLRSPEEVPSGWAALVVHRPGHVLRDAAVDYRIHVGGDRVGTIGPGEILVIGLPPGEHRVRGRLGRRTGAPVTVAVAADTVSHLTVEPGGPGGTPYAGHTPRPEEYILLTPGEPAAPPAPEPRSGR